MSTSIESLRESDDWWELHQSLEEKFPFSRFSHTDFGSKACAISTVGSIRVVCCFKKLQNMRKKKRESGGARNSTEYHSSELFWNPNNFIIVVAKKFHRLDTQHFVFGLFQHFIPLNYQLLRAHTVDSFNLLNQENSRTYPRFMFPTFFWCSRFPISIPTTTITFNFFFIFLRFYIANFVTLFTVRYFNFQFLYDQ